MRVLVLKECFPQSLAGGFIRHPGEEVILDDKEAEDFAKQGWVQLLDPVKKRGKKGG